MRRSIEDAIINNAIIRANTHYYSYYDSIKLIDLLAQHSIMILGIDAFIIDDRTIPQMEHSIDFSNAANSQSKKDVYTLAKEFLYLKRDYGFFFEIVYSD